MVVGEIRAKHAAEMPVAEDELVQALAANRAHEPFGVTIGGRRLDRGLHHLDTHRCQDGVEHQREPRVPVPNQEPEPVGTVVKLQEQVAGLLGHPLPGRAEGGSKDLGRRGSPAR